MYLNLLPLGSEAYRGIERELPLATLLLCADGEDHPPPLDFYEAWLAAQDSSFTFTSFQQLLSLRDMVGKTGRSCEIIIYSEKDETLPANGDFLGFDVYWQEEDLSGVKGDGEVLSRFRNRLNQHGLFADYEDAREFCNAWTECLADGPLYSPPKVFFVWALM